MAKQVDITYGNALFELAVEENKVDMLFEEAKALLDIFKESPDFIKLLDHPQMSKEEKKAVVEATFDGRLSKDMTGLIIMVVDKGHSLGLESILVYFIKKIKKYKNIGVASVTSAVALSDSQKAAIENRLIETTDYDKMEITFEEDPSLIGGLVIRIEDRVVDSSIKSKLDKLSKSLANA